jgi:c-di-GMP-binding flagellar brake protein YcgR
MANERRRFVRFQVNSPTYAALGHDFDKVGKVKNISVGGFAFEYISDQDSMEATTQVDIVLVDDDVHLSKVPCTVAYDHDVRKHDALRRFGRPLVTKRCGVKFGTLAENQREQLENLITKHTLGPLP